MLKALILTAVCFVLLPGAQLRTAAQRPKTMAVRIPKPIQDSIRQQLQQEMTVDSQEMAKLIAGLVATTIDLNADGKSEWKIRGTYGLCGNASCYCWLYRKTATGYEVILPRGYGDDMVPTTHRTNGYLDLKTKGGLFKFDGNRYQFHATK